MKLKLEFFENQCVMAVDWTNWSADNKKEKKKMNPVLFHPSPSPFFYQLLHMLPSALSLAMQLPLTQKCGQHTSDQLAVPAFTWRGAMKLNKMNDHRRWKNIFCFT